MHLKSMPEIPGQAVPKAHPRPEVILASISQGFHVLKEERHQLKSIIEQSVSSNQSNQLRVEWPHTIAEVANRQNRVAERLSHIEGHLRQGALHQQGSTESAYEV